MPVSRKIAPLRASLTVALVAIAVSLAVPSRAAAQVALAAPTLRTTIDDLMFQWASLERPLLNVPGLTDLQRDAIEALEERYRKQFNEEAVPIRAARLTMSQRGPFERQAVDRALARMIDLRKQALAQLRTLLTDTQRVTYDENLRVIAAEEAAAEEKREREAAFYTP